jgi:hypothetical protein
MKEDDVLAIIGSPPGKTRADTRKPAPVPQKKKKKKK